jgi:hypothetical protein
MLQEIPVLVHNPRVSSSARQDLMPGRYSIAVQLLSMAAFTLAFAGWLNETWLFWFENPVWLNRYTEYAIILGFGIWRIMAERNPYTRKRFIILVVVVTVFWWLIPWLYPVYEPYVGFLWAQPVFPSLHVPGTLTFFLILGLVFLFGRRIICGFGCPCVGIRETVGFPFRKKTPRSKWTWRLRHSKWFFFSYYVGIVVVTQFPPNSWTVSFVGGFYLIVAMTYFGTFFLMPLVAAQSCRLLRHRNENGQVHRLPALRTGVRHGYPGVGAGQADRAGNRDRGLHGLCPLRGVLSHGCAGNSRCAQPVQAKPGTERQPPVKAETT